MCQFQLELLHLVSCLQSRPRNTLNIFSILKVGITGLHFNAKPLILWDAELVRLGKNQAGSKQSSILYPFWDLTPCTLCLVRSDGDPKHVSILRLEEPNPSLVLVLESLHTSPSVEGAFIGCRIVSVV